MPKPQKPPTWLRLLQLAIDKPLVEIDWGPITPSSLDAAERDGVEDVCELVKEATRLLQREGGSVDDLTVEGALTELCDRIGAKLQTLNATGVFISAERRSETYALRDGETGTEHPGTIDVVRLEVLRPFALTA